MISSNEDARRIRLYSDQIDVTLDYATGIGVESWKVPGTEQSLPLSSGVQVCEILVSGGAIQGSAYAVTAVDHYSDGPAEFVAVTARAETPVCDIALRVSILTRGAEPPRLIVQLGLDWRGAPPQHTQVRAPFLAEIARANRVRLAKRLSGEAGREDAPFGDEAVWSQWDMPPILITDGGGTPVQAFEFPILFPWQTNNNRPLATVGSPDALTSLTLDRRSTAELTDVIDMHVYTELGWPALFESWRSELRGRHDLRRYQTRSAEWARHAYLHHFAFAYGKEIYDYDEQRIRIDKLLDDGMRFGGYDAVIFWHQYPRLGLDERTQWDLYDELPAGREEIKLMAEVCHERDCRLLMPFKPWDVRAHESLDDQAEGVRRLVAECGVDGFFLDTMSSIPESFLKLQERFPELLFASEGTPREPRPIEQLVCSWDQRPAGHDDVNTNLFRFIFPEHALNMIQRFAVGDRKDNLIRRAIFNGTGLVIWQDIFGSWLPWSDEQAETIKAWKTVLTQNHELIFGDSPSPLVPTADPALLSNRFATSGVPDSVVTIYNRSSSRYRGPALAGSRPADAFRAALLISTDGEATAALAEAGSEGAQLEISIAPREVVAVLLSAG